ncbi:N-6 DNA methylase [Lactobacillus murinus]|uniref:Type II methyltransferase M.TaqI-like domain-containing protein n=2 Tax=Ligilactobacillus murinus TaxID=1622 RepID=A0AAE7BQX0_9LACO|nr:N-6 DNA methylase [Ligilactobacillus murinus]NEF85196.1 N-6 DNA methylase [Ligilactobacillus murinus]NEF87613.1 N-6 DNA methylase [Ligilactobacillus murinus]NEF89933.1 N-6 DNA methylase [Ligilactobacillus murinus]NEF92204.1 N-6 DNA methylase [Ligilactobacillus murinus]
MNYLEEVKMKFDIVIGNPPYQENDNGKRDDGAANASASPIYNHFFYLAREVALKKVNLIFPARWLNGAGKGLSDFRRDMLQDQHIRSMSVFKNASMLFPNTDIKGGVLYLTYDKEYIGPADISVIDHDEQRYKFKSYLNSAGSGVFIPYGELVSIFEKVSKVADLKEENIGKITSVRKPYGLATNFFNDPQKFNLPEIYEEKQNKDDIEILGLIEKKRTYRYVPVDYPIPDGRKTIYKWKVFASKAMGSGEFGEKVPSLSIGAPGQIATETFIRIGAFNDEFEVKALRKYYYSKFFRAMLGISKTTHDAPARVYSLIPLQDFTKNSDIDWSLSISKIDQQLYEKYGLDQEEVNFIESKVRSMG